MGCSAHGHPQNTFLVKDRKNVNFMEGPWDPLQSQPLERAKDIASVNQRYGSYAKVSANEIQGVSKPSCRWLVMFVSSKLPLLTSNARE